MSSSLVERIGFSIARQPRASWTLLLLVFSLSTGCDVRPGGRSAPAEEGSPAVDSIDGSTGAAAGSAPGDSVIHARALQPFGYTALDSASLDVDGDGSPERIELLATVERNAAGALLWEDGHHWAVVVRDDSLAYPLVERFLPWGRAEFVALNGEGDARAVIVVITRAGSGCAEGEGSLALAVERFSYDPAANGYRRSAVIEASGSGVCAGEGVTGP